ncbi:hypothetical protein [Streptomyces sp. CBMA123]|uniref:hypothetical protein n=1 Tax=Streptomyces sp. CBMA123 TaxID=1896313 RepID=UPI00294FF05A|nr:hypothetical protein [Streptomyces sp. CBMA123]
MADFLDEPHPFRRAESPLLVGVTTVPGGCIVTQPWGFAPTSCRTMARLTAGTVGYSMFANPKSGNQGHAYRDGREDGWHPHPGGSPMAGHTREEVLAYYLYRHNAIAHACAFAGLHPTDARAVTGPADTWIRLPERGYGEG